jgi:ferritin-like metal-binding protein YciE
MRMEQHLRETEAQREQLGTLIEEMGEGSSFLKDTMGKVMAARGT